MTFYRKTYHNATRAAFARDAVFAEFRPNDGPRHIGEVTNKVVDDVGRRTITYWLTRATTSDGAERVAAIETAEKIRQKMGLTWDNLIGRRAA